MPILNQNFTKFEHDTFVIQYTVTDASTTLENSNYCGWWGLGNASTIEDSTSIELQGHSIASTDSYNIAQTNTGTGCHDSPNGGALLTTNLGPVVAISTFTVLVSLSYDLFDDIADGQYYHELVLMDKVSSICYQCRSQVVSSGVLTVNQSLFTEYSYR